MSTTRTPKRSTKRKGSDDIEQRALAKSKSKKTAPPTEPAPPTKPAQPTKNNKDNDEQGIEIVVLKKLLAHPMYDRERLQALLERINWEERYKPTIDDLVHARDVAEAVATAMMVGSERSWKAITEAWRILCNAGTLADCVMRQVEAIATTIEICRGDPRDLDAHAHHLRSILAYWDPAFKQLDPNDIERDIAAARQGRGGKGGRGNFGAVEILARLSVLCGANGAPQVNRRTKNGRVEFNTFKGRIAKYARLTEASSKRAKPLPSE